MEDEWDGIGIPLTKLGTPLDKTPPEYVISPLWFLYYLFFLSFFSLFWMTRREQGYLRIAINVFFFFQYYFCYHFKFILVRISTTPFLRLCHFFFFFPMMGGIWALLGVLFLLLSMLVAAWYRGRGKC